MGITRDNRLDSTTSDYNNNNNLSTTCERSLLSLSPPRKPNQPFTCKDSSSVPVYKVINGAIVQIYPKIMFETRIPNNEEFPESPQQARGVDGFGSGVQGPLTRVDQWLVPRLLTEASGLCSPGYIAGALAQ